MVMDILMILFQMSAKNKQAIKIKSYAVDASLIWTVYQSYYFKFSTTGS